MLILEGLRWPMVLVPLFMGLWLLWQELPPIVEGWRSKTWPSVEGKPLRATVQEQRTARARSSQYLLLPRYAYSVNGVEMEGTRLALFDPRFTSKIEADEEAARFLARKRMRVYYNPDRPERSVLDPGVPAAGVFMTVVGVAFLGLSVWAWFWVERQLGG